MTQNEQILEHLKTKGGITQKEAVSLYHIYRLSARISDIKHMGYKINFVTECGRDRYGNPTRWSRYTLGE